MKHSTRDLHVIIPLLCICMIISHVPTIVLENQIVCLSVSNRSHRSMHGKTKHYKPRVFNSAADTCIYIYRSFFFRGLPRFFNTASSNSTTSALILSLTAFVALGFLFVATFTTSWSSYADLEARMPINLSVYSRTLEQDVS